MTEREIEALNRDWAEYEEVLEWSGDISADARWIGFMLYRIHRDMPEEQRRRLTRNTCAPSFPPPHVLRALENMK